MKANEVEPRDWLRDENYPIRILYESEEDNYSVIWGKYKDHKALGVRLRNGRTNHGYSGQGGHPTWYLELDFIAIAIIQRLLITAIDSRENKHLENIIFALNELTEKMTRITCP